MLISVLELFVMSSAKQNPCGSMDLEITSVNKGVTRDCGVCVHVCFNKNSCYSVSCLEKVRRFSPLMTDKSFLLQADGRYFFLNEKFRSGSSLNNPLVGVHKLATVYSF